MYTNIEAPTLRFWLRHVYKMETLTAFLRSKYYKRILIL